MSSVITQEIHRLPQLGHRVRQALACLPREQGEDLAVVLFVKIGCCIQNCGPLRPRGNPWLGISEGLSRLIGGRDPDLTHMIVLIGGVDDRSRWTGVAVATNEGCNRPGM